MKQLNYFVVRDLAWKVGVIGFRYGFNTAVLLLIAGSNSHLWQSGLIIPFVAATATLYASAELAQTFLLRKKGFSVGYVIRVFAFWFFVFGCLWGTATVVALALFVGIMFVISLPMFVEY